MRTPLRALAVLAVICGAPLVLGGIVLTTVTATLAAAQPRASSPTCTTAQPRALAGSRAAWTIDRWIAAEVPTSPLVGLGPTLVAGVAGSDLDPRLLAAIAMQETRLGTLGGGPTVHNPFGLGPGLAFASWRSAIALAVHTLEVMRDGGAETIAEIAVHWAPIGAANDPANLNANWVGGVAAVYAQLGGDPSASVFGSPTAGAPRPAGPRTRCGPNTIRDTGSLRS